MLVVRATHGFAGTTITLCVADYPGLVRFPSPGSEWLSSTMKRSDLQKFHRTTAEEAKQRISLVYSCSQPARPQHKRAACALNMALCRPTNPSCAPFPSVTILLPFQSDLEVADREVDRLEHTVASLRDQLQEARGGSDGDSVGGGRDDSSGSTEGKSECTLLSTNTPGDQHEVREQRNGSPVALYIIRTCNDGLANRTRRRGWFL